MGEMLNQVGLTHSRFFCLFCFYFETEFLSVTVLAVLELSLVDQSGLELSKIPLSLPPACWD